MTNKIIIGTANFGLNYGIANQKKMPPESITKVLKLIVSLGLWGIDTAKDYGEAENIIGEVIKRHQLLFKIITKISPDKNLSRPAILAEVEDSLTKLNVSRIDYVLVHSYQSFQDHKKDFVSAFEKLVQCNLIRYWGVSLYHPDEAEELLQEGLSDIAIEFPLNIFDHRFLKSDLLKRLKHKRFQLFSRSVFLQGLFFLSPDVISPYFSSVKEKIDTLQKLSRVSNLSIADIALLFVASQQLVDGIIIGVDSPEQFLGNLNSLSRIEDFHRIERQLNLLETKDQKILLPYLWPVQ